MLLLVNIVVMAVSCCYGKFFDYKDDEDEDSRGGTRMSRTHNLHRVPHVRLEEVRLTTNCVIPPSIPLTFLCFNIGCSVCVMYFLSYIFVCVFVCLCVCVIVFYTV